MKYVSLFFLFSSIAFGADCQTDCNAVAKFSYPCPVSADLHRKCVGREPGIYLTCEATKRNSCRAPKRIPAQGRNNLQRQRIRSPRAVETAQHSYESGTEPVRFLLGNKLSLATH